MSLHQWFKLAEESAAFRPAFFQIKPENTPEVHPPEEFDTNQQYFEVVVNELYLSYKRKWFHTFEPTVFVISRFEYAGKKVEVPYVVGPSMISQHYQKLPAGFLFKNTSVAGIHPFKGQDLGITIILSRMPTGSPLRKLINVIEKFTGTYSNELKTAISGYMKIAKVALDSIESLTDSDDIKPIIGASDSFTKPGYFVLINQESKDLDKEKFYVTNNGLCYSDRNTEFREDDYVLFSIRKMEKRKDVEQLAPFVSFRKVMESLGTIQRKLTEDEKRAYRGQLLTLASNMKFDSDLTDGQARLLIKEYKARLEEEIADRDLLSGGGLKHTAENEDELLGQLLDLQKDLNLNGN